MALQLARAWRGTRASGGTIIGGGARRGVRCKAKGKATATATATEGSKEGLEEVVAGVGMATLGTGEKKAGHWSSMWAAGLAPGQAFDAERSSPVLVRMLREGRFPTVRGGRVLVPGCGRGYDPVAFAVEGGAALALGLELSAGAVAAAEAYRDAAVGSAGGAADRIRYAQGNFFERPPEERHTFDLVFDYTFFCAITPASRAAWGVAMAGLLKEDGELATLMFPEAPLVNAMPPTYPDGLSGPPFPVCEQAYRAALEPAGFHLSWAEPVPPAESHQGRQSRETMAVWRKTPKATATAS